MSLANKFKMKLNTKEASNKFIPVVTANDTTIFEFEVYDGKDEIELLETYNFNFVTKPVGKGSVLYPAELNEDGNVVVELNFADVNHGHCDCALVMYEGEKRVSTMRMKVDVKGDLSLQSDLPSESRRLIIADADELTKAVTAASEVEAAIGTAESLAVVIAEKATAGEVEELRDKTNMDKTELLSGIATINDQMSINIQKIDKNKDDLKDLGLSIKDFMIAGETSDDRAFQRASDHIRNLARTNAYTKIPYLRVPSGTYRLAAEVKLSPLVEIKSEGFVQFIVAHAGTGFWICQEPDDTKTQTRPEHYHLGMNSWNRGTFLDGSNGGIVFSTTNQSTAIALEIGMREWSSALQNDAFPVSRYVIRNVNIFNFKTGLQLNMCDHYLGNFQNLHIEGCETNIYFKEITKSHTYAGENFVFESCVIANNRATGYCVLVDSPAVDVLFTNTSFDFARGATVRITESGSSFRFDSCYFENGASDPPLVQAVAKYPNMNTWFSRISVYFSNCISLQNNPIPSVVNVPYDHNGTPQYLNLLVRVDGVETRYVTDNTKKTGVGTRFWIEGESVMVYGKSLINGNLGGCHIHKGLNILGNGGFERSTVDTLINNTSTDNYWSSNWSNNVTVPKITNDGIEGSKCIRVDVTPGTISSNGFTLLHKKSYKAEGGDIFHLDAIFKTDVLSKSTQVICALECYDSNDILIGTVDNYNGLYGESTDGTLNPAEYRMLRGVSVIKTLPGTSYIKPKIVVTKIPGSIFCIDDVVLTRIS